MREENRGLLPFLNGLWLQSALRSRQSAVATPAEWLPQEAAVPQPSSVLIIYILHLSQDFFFFDIWFLAESGPMWGSCE